VVSLVESIPYPCVLHLATDPKDTEDRNYLHSCLVLGPDETGDIIVWEKEGYEYPYQLTSLSHLYACYTDERYKCFGGVRSLRTRDHNDSKLE
jgi:hypothetical protein